VKKDSRVMTNGLTMAIENHKVRCDSTCPACTFANKNDTKIVHTCAKYKGRTTQGIVDQEEKKKMEAKKSKAKKVGKQSKKESKSPLPPPQNEQERVSDSFFSV